MSYQELIEQLSELGIEVKEKPLQGSDGRIYGCYISIREDIESRYEKSCVLSEELGHLFTTVGDITRLSNLDAAKQERRARKWAYEFQLPLSRLHEAQEAGCNTFKETAAFLEVSERFLSEALEYYELTYGPCSTVGDYKISFNPLYIERI